MNNTPRVGLAVCGRWFLAWAPLTWIERILDDGSGPTYHENAVIYVYARNKQRAQVLAIRAFCRARKDNRPDFVDHHENPFAAVKVEDVVAVHAYCRYPPNTKRRVKQ